MTTMTPQRAQIEMRAVTAMCLGSAGVISAALSVLLLALGGLPVAIWVISILLSTSGMLGGYYVRDEIPVKGQLATMFGLLAMVLNVLALLYLIMSS